MKVEQFEETINLAEGVSVNLEGDIVTIKGPKGEVKRKLPSKKVAISTKGNELTLLSNNATKREKKVIYTFKAHIKNAIKGSTQGHEYKLKICSGHFPMNVSVKGQEFEVKNFIGENVPRTMPIKQGVDVKVNGDEIVVTGIDKELVAQTAARIENLTKRPGFDTRIFQDGIYITEKDGRKV